MLIILIIIILVSIGLMAWATSNPIDLHGVTMHTMIQSDCNNPEDVIVRDYTLKCINEKFSSAKNYCNSVTVYNNFLIACDAKIKWEDLKSCRIVTEHSLKQSLSPAKLIAFGVFALNSTKTSTISKNYLQLIFNEKDEERLLLFDKSMSNSNTELRDVKEHIDKVHDIMTKP